MSLSKYRGVTSYDITDEKPEGIKWEIANDWKQQLDGKYIFIRFAWMKIESYVDFIKKLMDNANDGINRNKHTLNPSDWNILYIIICSIALVMSHFKTANHAFLSAITKSFDRNHIELLLSKVKEYKEKHTNVPSGASIRDFTDTLDDSRNSGYGEMKRHEIRRSVCIQWFNEVDDLLRFCASCINDFDDLRHFITQVDVKKDIDEFYYNNWYNDSSRILIDINWARRIINAYNIIRSAVVYNDIFVKSSSMYDDVAMTNPVSVKNVLKVIEANIESCVFRNDVNGISMDQVPEESKEIVGAIKNFYKYDTCKNAWDVEAISMESPKYDYDIGPENMGIVDNTGNEDDIIREIASLFSDKDNFYDSTYKQ